MLSRTTLPDPEEFSSAQRAVYDSIVASRGNIDGPFLSWLHSPVLAARAERLGAFCRYETSLNRQEVELLILVIAAHYRCNGEWAIHAPIALEAGVPPDAVEAIRHGRDPAFTNARLRLLHRFALALTKTNRIDEETFAAAARIFDQAVLVETVGVLGYYALVAMTLNAFEMSVSGAAENVFD